MIGMLEAASNSMDDPQMTALIIFLLAFFAQEAIEVKEGARVDSPEINAALQLFGSHS